MSKLVRAALPMLLALSVAGPWTLAGETRFPDVRGKSLSGKTYDLPSELEGENNLLFVAFRREQQEIVDTWIPDGRRLAAGHAGLQVYELPVLGNRFKPMRWFIDGGMRRGIPDPVARASTITIYTDTGAFRSALGIPDDADVHVLLVDREGRILWRSRGRLDPEKLRSLATALGESASP